MLRPLLCLAAPPLAEGVAPLSGPPMLFLAIVSSNLDEFFEVRAELHLASARSSGGGRPAFEAIASTVRQLVNRQYALYQNELLPQLAQQGIRVIAHGERSPVQHRWVRALFEREFPTSEGEPR